MLDVDAGVTAPPGARLIARARNTAKFLLLGALVGLLALNSRHYYPFFSDDALISLRYGRRLASGLGLTWTDGERVEGYTDLLWVLFAAAAAKLGADQLSVARVLDFIGAATAIGCAALAPCPLALRTARISSGALLLALSAPLAVWAIGGLEHGFMCGVLALGLMLLARALRKPYGPRGFLAVGAPFAALVLLRGDGVVLFSSALFGLALTLFRTPRAATRLAAFAVLPVILLLAQLAFRVGYYGELVPNTALAKVSFNFERVRGGLRHLGDGIYPLWPVLAAFILTVGAALRRPPRAELWIPASVLCGWCAYLVLMGGDIFPGWRQLLLAFVPLAMLLSEVTDRLASTVARSAALVVMLIPPLGYSVWLQRHDTENVRAKQERWEWDGLGIGRLLAAAFGSKRPLLAVDAAGALPYWSNLPALDMLGLTNRHIARHRPPGFGHGEIGHELGDGGYVLARRPDIVAFNGAAGARDPIFRSGRELVRHPEFNREYQFLRVRPETGNGAIGELFIRREGGKLGIERSEARVFVPGWFFASADGPPAELEDGVRLVTPLTREAPGSLDPLTLSAGTWTVQTDPPDLMVGFRCPDASAVRDSLEVTSASIRLASSGPVRITIAPADGTNSARRLRSITLLRGGGAARHRCAEESPPTASLADLLTPPPESSHWAAPQNLVLSEAGVVVSLRGLACPARILVSTDANDQYTVDFMNSGAVLGTSSVGPLAGRSGMAFHEITVDPAVARTGVDALQIVPRGGDGRYSVGHLHLEP